MRACMLGFVWLVGGCAEQFEIIDDGQDESVPAPVQEAFDRSCATGGCHDSASRVANLSLAPADAPAIIDGVAVQSDLPLVELGSIEGSYLAIKLLPDDGLPEGVQRVGTIMPPDPTADERVDMAVILGWIAGADLESE